jgi:hypothetical protein
MGGASASIDSHGISGPTMVVSMAIGPCADRERLDRDDPERDPGLPLRDERAEVEGNGLKRRVTARGT